MRYQLVHVHFGPLESLPPLIHETDALAGDSIPTAVLAFGTDSAQADGEEISPSVHLFSLKQSFRRISPRHHPYLKFLRYVETIIRSFRFLITLRGLLVVAHDLPALLPVSLYGFLFSKPVLYRAHELWFDHARGTLPLAGIWKWVEKYIARRVRRVITPEENRSRLYSTELRLPRYPVTVRNVPPRRVALQRNAGYLSRFGFPESVRHIMIYQGLFDPSRCLLELITACSILPDSIGCILVGGGDVAYTDGLRNAVRSLEIVKRVRIEDKVAFQELDRYTSSSDIGILLYRNDSRNNYYCASNKFYEYLHAGLVVVASDFPAIRTIVSDMDAGRCVLPFDPADIARSVQELVADPNALAIRREKIRLHSNEHFTWEREFPRLKQLYCDELLKEDLTDSDSVQSRRGEGSS